MAQLMQGKELGGVVVGHEAGEISRDWMVKGLGHHARREQETREGFSVGSQHDQVSVFENTVLKEKSECPSTMQETS